MSDYSIGQLDMLICQHEQLLEKFQGEAERSRELIQSTSKCLEAQMRQIGAMIELISEERKRLSELMAARQQEPPHAN